jgi:hypothetical protein
MFILAPGDLECIVEVDDLEDIALPDGLDLDGTPEGEIKMEDSKLLEIEYAHNHAGYPVFHFLLSALPKKPCVVEGGRLTLLNKLGHAPLHHKFEGNDLASLYFSSHLPDVEVVEGDTSGLPLYA